METTEITDVQQDSRAVYELGYLLVPTIAEENVPAEVLAIKSIFEKNGGALISEDFPKLITLAYSMPKTILSQRYNFDKAYFGWAKYEVESENLAKVKAELDLTANLLRYLIISTVKENTLFSQKMSFRPAASEGEVKKPEDDAAVAPPATPVSEEELDKTIEELVVQ